MAFMKPVLFLFTCIIILVIGCNKPKEINTDEVWIRIENNTAASMNDIKISDVVYNNLAPQNTTEYKLISFPIYGAYCNFKVNGQDTWAGYGVCGSPMPPPFESGYYTFKVGSTASPNYFSIEVTKR